MKWLIAALALIAFAGAAEASPCDDPGSVIQYALINAGTSAATYTLVAPSAKQQVHLCSLTGTIAGTTPTMQFVYGTTTSTPCDTNAVNISGLMVPTSGQYITAGWGSDLFETPAGNSLCVTLGGTSPSFQGFLSYVAWPR